MTDLTFTALLCSRLCHDLVGPVGAIGNGIELLELEDDPSMAGDALGLLKQSAENAGRRLKFLRLAFGASGGDAAPLPLEEARAAAIGFFADDRLELDWPPSAGGGAGKDRVRLALNLVMAAAHGLRRGGTMAVDVAADGAITVSGTHERAALPDALVEALEGRRRAASTEDARIIEAFHARLLAEAGGIDLAIEQSTGRFVISAV